ncbi:hypothetical protein [Halarcobacter anaerophilus]|nr:hypothetical protein [Halarcobacter anaerophilus]
MSYADKLKKNSSKIKTHEKVLDEKDIPKKRMGRPKKQKKK